MKPLTAFLSVAFLAGCASVQPIPDAEQPANSKDRTESAAAYKQSRVSRDLRVAWDNIGRGGAALRQPGYVHVLGDSKLTGAKNRFTENTHPKLKLDKMPSPSKALDNDGIHDALAALNNIQRGKGYSHYELSRWERYCDSGRGMDERDWRFVEREGAQNAPTALIGECTPPAHSYQDYLAAWIRFCTRSGATEADRQIVRHSVRPASVVNPCKSMM